MKKYSGKLTKSILSQIRHSIHEKTTKIEKEKVGKEVYQYLIENNPEFKKQVEMKMLPEYSEYFFFYHSYSIRGKCKSNRGYEYFTTNSVDLPVEFAIKRTKTNNEITDQAFFDKLQNIQDNASKMDDLFEYKLKIFVGKSLNTFFESFPEFEKHYRYSEPIPKIRADRQIIPAETVKQIRDSFKTLIKAGVK